MHFPGQCKTRRECQSSTRTQNSYTSSGSRLESSQALRCERERPSLLVLDQQVTLGREEQGMQQSVFQQVDADKVLAIPCSL